MVFIVLLLASVWYMIFIARVPDERVELF